MRSDPCERSTNSTWQTELPKLGLNDCPIIRIEGCILSVNLSRATLIERRVSNVSAKDLSGDLCPLGGRCCRRIYDGLQN